MNKWLHILIGVGVTAALLYWALSGVAVSQVIENIRRSEGRLLLGSSVVVTAGYLIRAMRWKVLLKAVQPDTSLRARGIAVSIHFMANNILPLRVGEFARAWVFSRLERVSASAAFGSVVVERFMDAVVLLIFLVIPVFLPGFPDTGALSEGWGGLILMGGLMAVLVVLVALAMAVGFPQICVRIAESIAPMLPKSLGQPLLNSLESFLASLTILRDPKLVALGFAWSFFLWMWLAGSFWLGMLAFGIDAGYSAALFTTAVVGFGVALPSTPGFLGTFQAASLFAISDVYGFAAAPALAFAFGYYFVSWLPITLIGLVALWRLGLSLGDVGSASEHIS